MIAILIILLSIVLDQAVKYIVYNNMSLGESIDFIPGFVGWKYIRNEGAAFGMLSEHRWVFLVISTVAIAAFIFYIIK